MLVKPGSLLWQYLSPQQRVLVEDGEFLLADSQVHVNQEPTDYSYLVFPFAKMYEGFLKQLFFDLDIISEKQYYSDRFRIWKALSPNFARARNSYSVYREIEERFSKGLATRMWHTWKEGRNLVFHYFPHNYRALTRSQAEEIITNLVETMDEAVRDTHVRVKPHQDFCLIGQGNGMHLAYTSHGWDIAKGAAARVS
jgi:hypothetical protein